MSDKLGTCLQSVDRCLVLGPLVGTRPMARSLLRPGALTIGVVVAVFALVGCGGGGSSYDAFRAKRDIRAADQARAERIGLRLADFHAAWRADKFRRKPDRSQCFHPDLSGLTETGR